MTKLAYSTQIFNESGYVLLYPNLATVEDLLQATPPNPYAESATQLFPLGTKLIQAERGWWYCKNAATALDIAAPLQGAAAIHAEQDNDIAVGAIAAIGATQVSLTSTANLAASPLSTKDGIKEGYLIVNDVAGEGQMYKIKGNAAFSGTSQTLIDLYDPLTIALSTSSQVGLIQHPCSNVVVSKAVMTNIFTGIPLIAVTLSYYFWAQMAGPAPVVTAAVIAKGSVVVLGATAAKATVGSTVTAEIAIGYPLTLGQTTDTEYMMVMLSGNW